MYHDVTNDRMVSTTMEGAATVDAMITEAIATQDVDSMTSLLHGLRFLFTAGFGKAVRVAPDGPRSLYCRSFLDSESDLVTYEFGVNGHQYANEPPTWSVNS